MKYSAIIIFSLVIIKMYAVVEPIIPGERLWDITERIGTTVDTIEEKVCNIEIITESAQDDLAIIESKTCIIDSKVDVLQSTQDECCSVIENIDSKLNILQSHSDMIESKIDIIDNKVDELQSMQDECCSVIEDIDSTLDVLIEDSCICCDVKITQLPFTITQSGVYCLAQPNLTIGMGETGITITAGTTDVLLDLSGHEINGQSAANTTGVLIEANCEQICVRNGIIRNTTLNGILVTNSSHLDFQNLKLIDAGTDPSQAGMQLSGSSFIKVVNVKISNSAIGFWVLNSAMQNTFHFCNAFECGTGFLIFADNNCLISCKSSENTSFGYLSEGNYNIFDSCLAQANGSIGFAVVLSNSNQFFNCISINNSNGFNINGNFNLLRDSIANQNTTDGIQTNGSNSIESCITVGNGMNGITANLAASDHVVNCLSHNNGTDYSGVAVSVTPPIPTTTGFWANVS